MMLESIRPIGRHYIVLEYLPGFEALQHRRVQGGFSKRRADFLPGKAKDARLRLIVLNRRSFGIAFENGGIVNQSNLARGINHPLKRNVGEPAFVFGVAPADV